MAKSKRALYRVLTDNNLTLSQRAVFALLAECTRVDRNFETTISELAEVIDKHNNSVALQLKALFEAGYIRRNIIGLGPRSYRWSIAI